MASVGIGYQPLQQFKPDYYKLPFNELLAGLSAKQAQYDKGVAEANAIPDLIPEGGLRTTDERNRLMSELDAELNPITEQLYKTGQVNSYELQRIAKKYKNDPRINWLKQDAAMIPAANKLMAEGQFEHGLQDWKTQQGIDQLKWTGQGMVDSQGRPVSSIGEAYKYIAPEDYQETFMKDIIENVIPQTGNLPEGTKVKTRVNKKGELELGYYNTSGTWEDFTYDRVKDLLKTPVGNGRTLQDKMLESVVGTKEGLFWYEKFKRDNGREPKAEDLATAKLESAYGRFYYKESPKETAISGGSGDGSGDKTPKQEPISQSVKSSLLFEGIDVNGEAVTPFNINEVTTNTNQYIQNDINNYGTEVKSQIIDYLGLPEDTPINITPNTVNGAQQLDLKLMTYGDGESVESWLKQTNPSALTALSNTINNYNAELVNKQQSLLNVQSVNDLFKQKYNITEDLENYIPQKDYNKFQKELTETEDAARISYKQANAAKIHELSGIIEKHGNTVKGKEAQEELNQIEQKAQQKATEHANLYKQQFIKSNKDIPSNVKSYISELDNFLNNEVLYKNTTFYPLAFRAEGNEDRLLTSITDEIKSPSQSSEIRYLDKKGKVLNDPALKAELNKLTKEDIKNNFSSSIGVDLNTGDNIVVLQGTVDGKNVALEIANIPGLDTYYEELAGIDKRLIEADIQAKEYRQFASNMGKEFNKNKTRAKVPNSVFTLHAVPTDDGDAKKGDLIFKLPETNKLGVAYAPTDYRDLLQFNKLYNNAKQYNQDINSVINAAIGSGIIKQVKVNLSYKDLPTNFQ